MRILFTGASSFTGTWFVRELHAAGHAITAVFPRDPDRYEGVRAKRVSDLAGRCERRFGVEFGAPEFVELIRAEGGFDLLCHHAACVRDYHSDAFDVTGALGANCRGLREVLEHLREGGCRRIVLTGSVFERGEGAGSGGLPSFSAYGLSKALTADVFEFYCEKAGLRLGKFVIPNPFGPLEEPRFTTYLARTWLAGGTAGCRTPDYVRDNIHVSLLAKAYASFAMGLPEGTGLLRFGPSGYAEKQGAFALRFAAEMRSRWGLPCELEIGEQVEWTEPLERVNTDRPEPAALGFDEVAAWDELAAWYRQQFGEGAHGGR